MANPIPQSPLQTPNQKLKHNLKIALPNPQPPLPYPPPKALLFTLIFTCMLQMVHTADCTLDMMCASCDTVNTTCLECHKGYILDKNRRCQPTSYPHACDVVDQWTSESTKDWLHPDSSWKKNGDWSKVAWECKYCKEGFLGNIGYKLWRQRFKKNNCKRVADTKRLQCDAGNLTKCVQCKERTYDSNASDGKHVDC
jgi:hypothetical protein